MLGDTFEYFVYLSLKQIVVFLISVDVNPHMLKDWNFFLATETKVSRLLTISFC